LTQIHTAVIAAFAQEPPAIKRGVEKGHSARDNPSGAQQTATSAMEVDDWDLV
jgi:hypothetical protein